MRLRRRRHYIIAGGKRRQKSKQRGSPRREALVGGPVAQLEHRGREDGYALERPVDGLEERRVALAKGNDDSRAQPTMEWGAHSLPSLERHPRWDRVRERLPPRQIEHDVADHVGCRQVRARVVGTSGLQERGPEGDAETPTSRSYSRRA